MFPLDKLSLKELTLKSVCLAALVSGQRAQSLHEMDLETSVRTDGMSISFFIKTLTKQTRPGIKTKPICIHQFAPEPALYAYATITKYIEVTSKLRKTSKLWKSFVRPHQEVGRQTISRWLKTTLAMSGIDISIFTAHSTRMASTSKAAAMGVALRLSLKPQDGMERRTLRNSIIEKLCLLRKNFSKVFFHLRHLYKVGDLYY